MSEGFATRYRPQRFEQMIGQRLIALTLAKMVEDFQVPPVLLFSGPSGSGKTTAARILANALTSDDQLNVIEIDAASAGGVDDVREMIETLRYSAGGQKRVVIYDEAHSMSREAYNALLLTIEEPPPGTVFIFVTTEPEKLPGTVVSRVTEFEFRTVTPNEILDRLILVSRKENVAVSTDLLAHIAERSGGNVRTALTSLDQIHRAGVETVADYIELTGEYDGAPALLDALQTGNAAAFFPVLDSQLTTVGNPAQIAAQLVSCLRDLLVIRAGGKVSAVGHGYDKRKELSLKLDNERVLSACKILWELKARVRGVQDARSDLELALMLIAETLSRGRIVPAPAPPAPSPTTVTVPSNGPAHAPRKMTLADLQRR